MRLYKTYSYITSLMGNTKIISTLNFTCVYTYRCPRFGCLYSVQISARHKSHVQYRYRYNCTFLHVQIQIQLHIFTRAANLSWVQIIGNTDYLLSWLRWNITSALFRSIVRETFSSTELFLCKFISAFLEITILTSIYPPNGVVFLQCPKCIFYRSSNKSSLHFLPQTTEYLLLKQELRSLS